MSTNAIAKSALSSVREWKRFPLAEPSTKISAMTSVNANRNRIFQALTVPEYFEAWFSPSGVIAGCTAVSLAEESFSINWCTQEARQRVFCAYLVCRRSKVVFTWQRSAPAGSASSVVRIRLLGDFGRTTVHITHDGLALPELEWHEDLWTSSLGKLSRLF